MRVREFIEWLSQFPDQDATVEVLECRPGAPYVEQGGVTSSVEFEKTKEMLDFLQEKVISIIRHYT